MLALGFVLGAWLLQQQAALPSLYWGFLPVVGLIIGFIYLAKFKSNPFQYKVSFKKVFVQTTYVFIVAILSGFFWAATCASIRLNDALPKDWQQKNIQIIGVVATLPETTEHGLRFQFDVEKTLTAGVKVPQRIALNFYGDFDAQNSAKPLENTASTHNSFQDTFQAGQRWQLTVRLKRPHTTYNPHGFDAEAWSLEQNIRATGNIVNKSGYKKHDNFVWRFQYVIECAREKIGNRIAQTLANKPYVGVIRALVIGDSSQITQADWQVYLRTGINHLVSISGLHITMLAGLAFTLTSLVWRRLPALVMRLPTRKAATIVGLCAAILYALLAGMSVPTQRTIYMLITFAFALLIGRNMAISRALAIALMTVVLLDPWAVNAPGFWLSFSAVAIIAYVTAGRLAALHWLQAAFNTQWAITLGLLPLLIVMFGQTSIISPIANAFAIPIISLIVVPLSIAGSLLPVDFLLQAAHGVLAFCMLGLNWLATLPLWQQAAPPLWAVLVAVLGVLWLLLPRGFPQRWLGFVLLLPLFFVHLPQLANGEMQVTVLDIGQGLAVVIKTANHTLLYDAGPKYSAQSDAGGRIVLPYLRAEGIQQLDGFIVSHNDSDHSGGMASVLVQMPVTWLASSFDAANTLSLPIKALPKKMLKCFAGQHWQWDSVQFDVLYPSWQSYSDASLSDNNRSCVLKVTSLFGSLLLTGDIEKEAEAALLATALQANRDVVAVNMLKSDVLIAPHHGSKTSSTAQFVQAVAAKQIIFTVGYLNRFKHPKPATLQRYIDTGALLYRSDYNGALQLNFTALNFTQLDFITNKDSTNKNTIKVNAWRQAEPKYWHDRYSQ